MAAPRKRSSSPSRHAGGGGEDRLSDLPDGVLGHILSFLPTKEAGRTAFLARRWRYMFANVHTMSFEQDPVLHMGDDYTFYVDAQERRSLNGNFLDEVCAAVLARRRCGGVAPNRSLRAFRLFFDDVEGYHGWDGPMVESLINHHYGSRALCRGPAAHGKLKFTLGKGFAERRPRQKLLGKHSVGKQL
ncbi:hypothetical protein ACP70R_016741 [Stipagrostis hirtigluma subsp. patula]